MATALGMTGEAINEVLAMASYEPTPLPAAPHAASRVIAVDGLSDADIGLLRTLADRLRVSGPTAR